MKKMRYISLLLVLAMLTVGLAGCGVCDHKWLPADCVNPRICNICGEMDGEVLIKRDGIVGKYSGEYVFV